MDLLAQVKQMSPDEVVALLRRNQELESVTKLRQKEATTLRIEHAKLQTEYSQLYAEQAQFRTDQTHLETRVEELNSQLEWFKRQLFGAKSERRILEALTDSQQLWLGEQMLDLPEDPPADDESAADVEKKARPKPRKRKVPRSEESSGSRLRFDDSIPVEEHVVPDAELESLPDEEVVLIGQDVTYRLAQRSPYVVLKHVRRTWKKKGTDEIQKAKLPTVIQRSFADVSLLAGLAVDKHCHHLPLYRQHKRMEQSGVYVERSTLTRLLRRVAEMTELVYQAQLSSILESSVITMDESPTPAGRFGGKMKRGYYWVLYGDKNEVAFVYSPSRARAVIDKLLEGFQGTLHSDGYRAYDSFCKANGVVWAGCWAHTRRKFVEAERKEPKKVKAIIKILRDLYEIEAEARGEPEALEKLRDTQSRPIVNKLFQHFKTELEESALLPSNRYIKALKYAIKHEAPLRVFLENPGVAIDTNHVEREIRPAVIGRKNWMFHFTENGARHSGILYTLLQTCRLQNVDPRTYLVDILQRMDDHPGKETYQLMPRLWKDEFGAEPIRSLVD